MEEVNCNFCGSQTEFSVIDTFASGIRVVRCSSCGLIYQNPRLTGDELIDYYNGRSMIYPHIEDQRKDFNETSVNQDIYLESRKKFFRGIFEKLARRLPSDASVCDVGCGKGFVLDVLSSEELATTKYRLFGVEPSTRDAAIAKGKGYEVFEGTLEACSRKDFDLIIMNDVFEHVPDPLKTLRRAGEILSPEGMIFIRVPNIDGILLKRLAAKFIPRSDQLQNTLGLWAIPEHTYNYSFKLLSKYAAACQLEVVEENIVPFEIYSNKLRDRVAKVLNVCYYLTYKVFGIGLSTAVYVLMRRSARSGSCPS